MREEHYQIISDNDFETFEFISAGPKGSIIKVVQYLQTEIENVYNLAFGDKIMYSDEFDDTVISNNGDTEKVMRTVASTIYAFKNKHPDAIIYATSSSKSRIRLY